jgi:hypothetical protein
MKFSTCYLRVIWWRIDLGSVLLLLLPFYLPCQNLRSVPLHHGAISLNTGSFHGLFIPLGNGINRSVFNFLSACLY